MRYYCSECGCEFWHFSNYTLETVKCPQCESIYVKTIDYTYDATF